MFRFGQRIRRSAQDIREAPQALAAYDLMVEIEALARLNIDKITVDQQMNIRDLIQDLIEYIDDTSEAKMEHLASCKRMDEITTGDKDMLDNIRRYVSKIFAKDVEDEDKDV